MSSLAGRTVLVTGGARGIGRACCEMLARSGASVTVCDIAAEDAAEVVAHIASEGGTAIASNADISTPDGGCEAVEATLKEFGSIDVVVNNAGFLRNNYFENLTLQQLDEVLGVHLRAAFFVTQPAWKVMKDRGYGRVINMGSASAMFSHQGLSNYAAAKSGLYGLTKALAYEGRPHGITVNAVLPNPGVGATGIALRDPIPDMAENSDQSVREVLRHRVSVAPSAAMVAYLAGEDCRITGEAFSVSSGRFARVFVGVTQGWLAPDVNAVTIEDVAERIELIRDQTGYLVPDNLFDENSAVAEMVRQLSG